MTIEELRQRLKESKVTIERIDNLNELSYRIYEDNPHEALELAQHALRLSTRTRDRDRKAHSHAMIAGALERLERNNEALESLQNGLKLVRETEETVLLSRILHQIGIVYTKIGDYPKGAVCLDESLELARANQDASRQSLVHNSLGVLFDRLGDYPRALEHYQQSLRLCESIGSRSGLYFINNNIGTIFLGMNNVQKAYEFFQRNAQLMDEGGNEWQMLFDDVNVTTSLFRLGRVDEARRRCESGIERSRRMNTPGHESYLVHLFAEMTDDLETRLAYQERAARLARVADDPSRLSIAASIGDTLFRLNRRDEAFQTLDATLHEAEVAGEMEICNTIHRILFRLYEEEGNAAMALNHHKRSTELTERIRGQEQQRAIVEMEMREEIERAERDREILRLEKVRLEEEMAHKTSELTALALNLIEKNQFLQALKNDVVEATERVGAKNETAIKDLIRKVDGSLHSERDWKAFEAQFEMVHRGFLRAVATRCPTLTRAELKVCALLRLNMSSKEVADVLSISARTAEHHRYRIRKKLGLADDMNVSTYLATLEV